MRSALGLPLRLLLVHEVRCVEAEHVKPTVAVLVLEIAWTQFAQHLPLTLSLFLALVRILLLHLLQLLKVEVSPLLLQDEVVIALRRMRSTAVAVLRLTVGCKILVFNQGSCAKVNISTTVHDVSDVIFLEPELVLMKELASLLIHVIEEALNLLLLLALHQVLHSLALLLRGL